MPNSNNDHSNSISAMQQSTTILQHLTFRPKISFNDPATLDGKLWNSALKQITRSQGWSQLHWGAQLASEEIVDLLITWTRHADLQNFMAHNYRPILDTVEPLLLRDNSSPGPIPAPYIMQLHPGMPSLDLGALSALYELSFTPKPDADVKTGLAIEAQLCRNFFLDAAQGIGDGDSFLGMDAVWVERFDPLPPSSSSPLSTAVPENSAVETKLDEETQAKECTLLLITEWASPAIETQILHSGAIETLSHDGQVLTTGEYFAKNLLQRASAHTKHHVVFENISPANVAWLDKEEKWSTHVARLMAEEERKRRREE